MSGLRSLGSKRRTSSSLEARISGIMVLALAVLRTGELLLPPPPPPLLRQSLAPVTGVEVVAALAAPAVAMPFLTASQLSGCTPSTRKALGCRNTSLFSERGG